MYYLQSRYYNPTLGRFINADVYTSTGQGLLGNNMFAYCRNSPVFRVDVSGTYDITCDTSNPLDEDESDDWFGGGTANSNNSNNYSYVSNTSNQVATSQHTSNTSYGSGNSTNNVAYSSTTTQSNSISYTDKVLAQMANNSDPYHSFPTIVDQFIPYGESSVLIGGDGIARTLVRIEGSINGLSGHYEYIFEPNGWCNHRFFNISKR